MQKQSWLKYLNILLGLAFVGAAGTILSFKIGLVNFEFPTEAGLFVYLLDRQYNDLYHLFFQRFLLADSVQQYHRRVRGF